MGIAYRKKDHIVYREEGDGAFLFDPHDGNLKYLNRLGKEIYLKLSDSRDTQSIVGSLTVSYPDIAIDQIEKDVNAFISELVEINFISSIEAHAPHQNG